MHFLLSYDDDDDDFIQGLDPMTYNKLMMINKDIKDISKRDSSLASSELDWGVSLFHIGKVGSLILRLETTLHVA